MLPHNSNCCLIKVMWEAWTKLSWYDWRTNSGYTRSFGPTECPFAFNLTDVCCCQSRALWKTGLSQNTPLNLSTHTAVATAFNRRTQLLTSAGRKVRQHKVHVSDCHTWLINTVNQSIQIVSYGLKLKSIFNMKSFSILIRIDGFNSKRN